MGKSGRDWRNDKRFDSRDKARKNKRQWLTLPQTPPKEDRKAA